MESSSSNCSNLGYFTPQFPYKTVGRGKNDIPLVCDRPRSTGMVCSTFVNNSWVDSSVTKMYREGSFGSRSPFANASHYMYITGVHKTAEVLTDDGWKLIGPPLPVNIRDHCTTLLNSTTVIVIGDTHFGSNATFIFNSKNDAWIKGPDANFDWSNRRPACGRIRLSKDSDKFGAIVEVAGFEKYTEVLEDAESQWYLGPELPHNLWRTAMVEDPSGNSGN